MSVKVEGLTKTYGKRNVVDHISFEAGKGEVLGFLGPNGAGKSTTMKMLTCFIPPTAGTATICGYDTAIDPLAVTKKIGYLPESNPLYYNMFVREYLQFAAGLYGLGGKTNSRIDEMLQVTGLTGEYKKKVGQLSKGYKQRVGLAQAMLHDPEVLILDEPTSGLDPNQLVEIRALIKQLGKNKTVIFSSHIMQEVQAVADRLVIINRGKIVADDTTAQLQGRLNDATVVVEFKQKIDRSLLGGLKGVKAFKEEKGRWVITADGDKDLREDLFNFAKARDLTLLSLYKEESSLEDIFKSLTHNA